MLLLLLFSFLAGVVTILSPCILPILPIVLSGSVGGGKRKPLGIIAGFIFSFTFFTLFLTKIVQLTGIPADTLRIVAALVLLFFGISLFVPQFQVLMERVFTGLSVFAPKANPNTGFLGGLVIGLSIGLIWAPCVGPIMASVIALAATSTVTTATFLITLSYAIGSGIPMFFIMYGGKSLLNKIPQLMLNAEKIQKGFGIVMILVAVAIFFNLDRNFEAFVASTNYGADLTNLENNQAVRNQLNLLKGNTSTKISNSIDTTGLFNTNTPAPDFVGIDKWLDTDKPLSIKNLKGKVVLVDFWTYTCINCIRTLPFVTSWYDKYKDQGFVVIGVHTPEFQFEHETANVENAIKQYSIHYPVAQDNEYATWNNYNNEYWPAEYLIDINGNIRRTHFGEGEYDQTEKAIQVLLQEAGKKVANSTIHMPDQTPSGSLSPETYLGSGRMKYYFPSGSLPNGTQTFSLSDNLSQNSFSYGGQWILTDEYAMAGDNATLNYNFTASKVFIILRPGKTNGGTVKVYLDGKIIDATQAGTDVKNGIVTVDSDRLYNVVDLHGKTENHVLKLEFQSPGIQAFTFTFG